MTRRPTGALTALLLVLSLSGTVRAESTSGTAEESDSFSNALATGDFDGDGRDDLAVGVAHEDVGDDDAAGVVNVIYSSPSGLKENGNQVWHQGVVDVLGTPETFDRFGTALASGDFDGDGFDDLAVGVPHESISGQDSAGVVQVLYGTSEGLTQVDNQLLTQDSVDEFAQFGDALAGGDFDGDGRDDLAAGAPRDTISGAQGAGSVAIFDGSAQGLLDTIDSWHQGSILGGTAEDDDLFGMALAAGNLGAGSQDDLVIGVLAEDLDDVDEGVLHVIYGSGDGLSSDGTQLWHQDIPGMANKAEPDDFFASSLAIGNFGRGRPADLAVGVPREDRELDASVVSNAGGVHVLFGSSEFGLTVERDQFWDQSKPGVKDRVEQTDVFGDALTAADLGKSQRTDLAIGVPSEDLDSEPPTTVNAGVVQVLFGSNDGLTADQDQLWHQDSNGVKNSAESGDIFGRALASGNFGSGSRADLAVGVPQEDLRGIDAAGAANVLYGTADGLSPAGDQFWHQTLP